MLGARKFTAVVLAALLSFLSFWSGALCFSARAADTITIATFNLQAFGQAKAGKPEVMKVLAETIARFDVVAIQEVRDKSGQALRQLEAEVDALGRPYATLSSPRLGRREPREQYAFLFRPDTVEPLGDLHLYEEPAGTDLYPREPFMARFRCKQGRFSFVLINLHTDPDTATEEILGLKEVLAFARDRYPGEGDFIILGDLNADCRYYQEEQANPVPGTVWIVRNDLDTTVKATDCTYDRIIITETCREDFTGEVQVFRFDQEFGLPYREAVKVSDHFPVWARFFVDRDTD